MIKLKIICLIFIFVLIFLSYNVSACKDIVACGDSTEGEYNLLMKVRDPSRPGLQVLCIVPKGYEYEYHDPRTGKTISYTTNQKYIGVATQDDVIPNIVKAGMALSESGIAYGDADSVSGWINYRRFAWDDFDWIRYACQAAETEKQAVELLTKDVVDEMHANGVSENLFVLGPNTGYVIEADAYRYNIKEIQNGIAVMSNYPKELWKTQILRKLPISRSFDTVVEKTVRKYGVVRLGSLNGIRIISIEDDRIYVKPISLVHKIMTKNIGTVTEISVGEAKTVGNFRVNLEYIEGKKAHLSVKNVYNAWEEKLLEYIEYKNGSIAASDMIKWSRLHEEDMDYLRPLCEDNFDYEAVTIYKIPNQFYETLSMGWFAPNHACSSIYVPFHICNDDIFEPYETGDAAQLSLDLLNNYGHDYLSNSFAKTEEVFFNEIESVEEISKDLLFNRNDISDFLTIIDTSMQKQAYLTQEIWLRANMHSDEELIKNIIDDLWENDYKTSLTNMKNAILNLKTIPNSNSFVDKIKDMALEICKSKIDSAESIGKQIEKPKELYNDAKQLILQHDYSNGFYKLSQSYTESDKIIREVIPEKTIVEDKHTTPLSNNLLLYLLVLIVFLVIMTIIVILRRKET
jgi:hypothetical protein